MKTMSHRTRVVAVLGLAGAFALSSCTRTEQRLTGSPAAQAFLVAGLDSLNAKIDVLEKRLADPVDPEQAIRAFRDARRDFKRVESLLTYYIPIQTALINGPRLEGDDDAADPPVKSAPIGFQVIEGALFDQSFPLPEARAELGRMRQTLALLRGIASTNPILPNAALDAVRLQLGRITTVGLAGIDADPSGDGIVEAAEAMDGLRTLTAVLLEKSPQRASADSAFAHAAAELRANPDFATFNRLRFIAGPVRELSHVLDNARREIGAPERSERRIWRDSVSSPFDSGAFSPSAFVAAHSRPQSTDLVALGERLFFDKNLSGPRTRSCASCHQPDRAFTDGLSRAEPIDRSKTAVLRNTPTLLNVAMQPAFFADDRALSLENQIAVVLASDAEMASSEDSAAARVRTDASYRAAFAKAMPNRADSTVRGLQVRQALAAYLRTLNAMDSRFDRAARGDTLAMTDAERRGMTVFLGRAKCGTCHFMPLFNGLTPPFYRTAEAEIIGVPATANLDHPKLDPDVGRANVEDNVLNRFAFKVTSLRNAAVTAPYMHNGVFKTLDEVVEFYDRGGGVGIGLKLPYQSLPTTPLKLTTQEKKDLVAFFNALTDTVSFRAKAARSAAGVEESPSSR
jgi:cytochrome c peroxidase